MSQATYVCQDGDSAFRVRPINKYEFYFVNGPLHVVRFLAKQYSCDRQLVLWQGRKVK